MDTMKFKTIPKSGAKISELSMGCGHLPVDDVDSTAVVKRAVEVGCNYFETATFYCNNLCQQKTGLGLSGERDGLVSVKAGIPPEVTAEEYRESILNQLAVLNVKSAGWLQVGWLSLENFNIFMENKTVLNEIYKMRDEGLFSHLGFTGHDTPENFIEIIKSGVFECVTLPYHMLNRSYEPTIKVAGEEGIGVVAMNPLGGGILGNVSQKLNAATLPGIEITSTAELALRFVISNPNVTSACSGMSSIKMVDENFKSIQKGPLTDTEYEQMVVVLDEFKALGEKFCTGCRYCVDCPEGIDIAGLFSMYNMYKIYGFEDVFRSQYKNIPEDNSPSKCKKCGICEDKCPNDIEIMKQMNEVVKLFT